MRRLSEFVTQCKTTPTHCNTHTTAHCNALQRTAMHSNTPLHTAMHCNALQCTATHCNTLKQPHCNTLQHTGTRCDALQRTATQTTAQLPMICVAHVFTHTFTLQRTATHCNTLKHAATHCNTPAVDVCRARTCTHTATRCNTLQHSATHCNTLQHAATPCNTLQHTATHHRPLLKTHLQILVSKLQCAKMAGKGGGGSFTKLRYVVLALQYPGSPELPGSSVRAFSEVFEIAPGNNSHKSTLHSLYTGGRRLIGCLKLQVIFRKRATNYRALLRKMTYEDKASYDSTPPCTVNCDTMNVKTRTLCDTVNASSQLCSEPPYVVATISRLLKIIGLFCRISSLL